MNGVYSSLSLLVIPHLFEVSDLLCNRHFAVFFVSKYQRYEELVDICVDLFLSFAPGPKRQREELLGSFFPIPCCDKSIHHFVVLGFLLLFVVANILIELVVVSAGRRNTIFFFLA